jgi:hypothetical protein
VTEKELKDLAIVLFETLDETYTLCGQDLPNWRKVQQVIWATRKLKLAGDDDERA